MHFYFLECFSHLNWVNFYFCENGQERVTSNAVQKYWLSIQKIKTEAVM